MLNLILVMIVTIVCNELLGREGIKIYQDTDCFNFSLDSILLANFVSIPKCCKKIVDLCCGNAPIPLYLSLRTNSSIIGVEIQEFSFNLACESVKINNKENIEILNQDLKGVSKILGGNIFDVVTCNPPFFKLGENNLNPDIRKQIARHEVMCTLEDVIKEAKTLLKNKGVLALVHRPERLPEILELMRKYKIAAKRIRFVYPKEKSVANHVLIEGVKGSKEGSLKILEPLVVYDKNGNWTDEIIKIYNGEE